MLESLKHATQYAAGLATVAILSAILAALFLACVIKATQIEEAKRICDETTSPAVGMVIDGKCHQKIPPGWIRVGV